MDIQSGAVSYHTSVHVVEDKQDTFIKGLQFKNKVEEGHYLLKMIEEERHRYPQQKMAILVRSRTHLVTIISLLRQFAIPYQGTDIDLLAHLEHLRDIWSLTQALLNPANRLTWLSLLRSPYCGLNLTDIHCIAQFDKKKSIYYALMHLDRLTELSEEGRMRAHFFGQTMHQALSHRYHMPLSDWVLQNEHHTSRRVHSYRNSTGRLRTILAALRPL